MAEVVINSVTKIYRDHHGKEDVESVSNVSLTVHDKEFMVLVGPSGCGKSTTLRMIAGLEEITNGEISIDGRVINDVPPKDRDIAMVFQSYALYPHMTVYDNMAFGLKLRKFTKSEIQKRVHEAADILKITEYLNRKPKALSGGQRQRVAVGRAIVRKPKVFLFDEPLSNLDAKMRVHMRKELMQLHKQLSATMIYVTHDQVEAMTMGDRIVVMNHGNTQQIDTPNRVFNDPQNVFVASFLGSPPMNFINGKIQENGKKGLVFQEAMGGTLEISITDALISELAENKAALLADSAETSRIKQDIGRAIRDYKDREVILGIRPENIELLIQGDPPSNASTFRATIDIVEPLGSETNMHLHTGAHSITCRSFQCIERSHEGHRGQFIVDKGKLYFFDVEDTPAHGKRRII